MGCSSSLALPSTNAVLPNQINKWSGSVLSSDGRVYGIPFTAGRFNTMLRYDPVDNTTTGIDTTDASLPGHKCKWDGGVAITTGSTEFIVGIPSTSEAMLCYDTKTLKCSGVDTSAIAKGRSKWSGGVVHKGLVYGIPHNADAILVYDPTLGTVTGVDVSSVVRGPSKYCGGVIVNEKLYCIPYDASCILIYDLASKAVSSVDVNAISSSESKWDGGVAVDGKIYGIPCNAREILEFDPSTGAVTGIDASQAASGADKWSGGVVSRHVIYGIPFNSKQILQFNPRTMEVVAVPCSKGGTSSTAKWKGGCLAATSLGSGGGCSAPELGPAVIACPSGAEKILIHRC